MGSEDVKDLIGPQCPLLQDILLQAARLRVPAARARRYFLAQRLAAVARLQIGGEDRKAEVTPPCRAQLSRQGADKIQRAGFGLHPRLPRADRRLVLVHQPDVAHQRAQARLRVAGLQESDHIGRADL